MSRRNRTYTFWLDRCYIFYFLPFVFRLTKLLKVMRVYLVQINLVGTKEIDPDSNIKRKVIREMNTDSILDDKDIIVNFFSGAITVL